MPSYLVIWKIEVEAKTPEAAAVEAFSIQRDPESLADYFEVVGPDGKRTRVCAMEVESS